jgi:hypothetical protein
MGSSLGAAMVVVIAVMAPSGDDLAGQMTTVDLLHKCQRQTAVRVHSCFLYKRAKKYCSTDLQSGGEMICVTCINFGKKKCLSQ